MAARRSPGGGGGGKGETRCRAAVELRSETLAQRAAEGRRAWNSAWAGQVRVRSDLPAPQARGMTEKDGGCQAKGGLHSFSLVLAW